MALSEEERKRIYEEERVRDSARTQLKGELNAKRNKRVLVLLAVFAGIGLIVVIQSAHKSRDTGQPELGTPLENGIPYETVDKWSFPNGGYGQVIVVSPGYRNERDMRQLGLTLKHDTKADRNAAVWIYDDRKAGEMFHHAMDLKGKEGVYYDNHFIGTYNRNINTGYHAIEIFVGGTDSARVEVKY